MQAGAYMCWSVRGERLWNKVSLLREKCLCVRVLSFLVTIEWDTRVCKVIHYLEWDYNLVIIFVIVKYFLRRLRGRRKRYRTTLNSFVCYYFSYECNLCCVHIILCVWVILFVGALIIQQFFSIIMNLVYNFPRLPYNSSKGKWICALGCCYSGCRCYKKIS